MKANLPQRGSDDAARKRSKILRAAIHEFSERGLAGARTDSIAHSAGVNKALLYYYFKSKNSLYTAAIEEVGSKVMESAMAALDSGGSPGESLLRSVLNHFDRLLTQHEFQNLMQQEMVRFRRGESETIALLVRIGLWAAAQEDAAGDARGHSNGRAMRGGLAADHLRRAGSQCFLLSQRADDAPAAFL